MKITCNIDSVQQSKTNIHICLCLLVPQVKVSLSYSGSLRDFQDILYAQTSC